jgi:cytochrome c biogenesis protein CcdA
MLSSIGSKKKMIKISSVYICTIYIVYFLSGLGLFSAFQSLKITNTLYTFGAIFLIIAGLINIKDFFWYGKGISLAIPASKKPIIEKYTRMATIPSAIILGFLVAIFELPCTGAWYLSILGMLADNMNRLKAIPLLLLYNFLFVLPLMIITFIVIKGFPPEKINQFSENKKKIFRLISGLIMLGLGIAMLIPGIF